MGRRLRFIPSGGALVEITCRTIQGRFLLKPTDELREIIIGTLGRAQRLYPVDIHAFVFMSNHYHLLLSVPDARRLAHFMGYVNSKLAREIARLQEDVLRGDRAYMEATMTVVSPRLLKPRVVRLLSWDDRLGKRSFIRILAPAKDQGTGFLMKRPNLWMYIPRVERTMRIPPSMMLQSWMGSDFTNDDLVKQSSQLDDYDHKLLGVDTATPGHEGLRAYVVEFLPHEDAPVVWGRIVSWIESGVL